MKLYKVNISLDGSGYDAEDILVVAKDKKKAKLKAIDINSCKIMYAEEISNVDGYRIMVGEKLDGIK